MKAAMILTFLFTLVALCVADDLPEIGIAPPEPAPPGCVDTYDGLLNLLVGPVHDTSLATKVKLKDGVLTDSNGRIGCIVANYQFQFDGPPPQAGSIYTGGFSKCENGSLAIGGTTVFWRCNSGEFDNWYYNKIAEYCQLSNVLLHPENDKSSSSSSASSASSTSSISISASISKSSSISSSASASSLHSRSASRNATITSAAPSLSRSVSITSAPVPQTTAAGNAESTSSTAAAILATRVPRPEMFGAVVGIIGAAFIF